MVERKLFLPNQSINIMFPNEENMIVVPTNKKIKIITSIQLCLVPQLNINYKECGGKISFFLQIHSIYIVYPNVENMIVVPITKILEIIMSIQVCLISRKMQREKLFLPNQSINIVYPYQVNMIVVPNNKKNGDYCEYQSLSHFMDRL